MSWSVVQWSVIPEFPDYSVSTEGEIRNNETERVLRPTANQSGLAQVGLMKDGRQYKRGVALIVAKAFIEQPNDRFNTPINLNGDRMDNRVDNLEWRPRWFAVKYHQQFHNDLRGFDRPIEDVATGEQFETSWEAATKYGLIDREILMATLNRTHVWPTYQKFRVLD